MTDLIALEIPVLELKENSSNVEKKLDEKINSLVNSKKTDISKSIRMWEWLTLPIKFKKNTKYL